MSPTEKADLAQFILRGAARDNERRQEFASSGWWVSIPLTSLPARRLMRGECRLDGEYYAAQVMSALRAVDDSGFESRPLGRLIADLYILDRFRRVYASDKRFGWPYLSASEALEFRPSSERWIAKDRAPKEAKLHFAKEGWLLVSSSGTVGRIVMTSKRLEEYFLTHDLIRVVPAETPLGGYLYAYLSTWIGQALVSKDQYGSAIKHLEPHHLAVVPIPLLPENEQLAIHAEILRAYALRDEANDLLDHADGVLHAELGLPRFDESLVPYLSTPTEVQTSPFAIPHPKAFTVRALKLDARLDASYHVPVVRRAIELLGDGKYEPTTLKRLAGDVYLPPRFKRIYVAKEHGIPFLRPSQLPQMRPYDLNYISHLTPALSLLRLNKGEVLVSTDGTIGRVGIVTSRTAGWAGSNNIARIAYGISDNRNGYLAAFLSTPYGQHQLKREVYGGVVDHIDACHVETVLIPDAPLEVQSKIGELVVAAHDKKDEATAIEEAAIARLEERLAPGNIHPLFEQASNGSEVIPT